MGPFNITIRKDIILILVLLAGYTYADNISSPPPLSKELAVIQFYFQEIYDNFHRLPIVTTNPDGIQPGKKGDMVHLQTGGKYYHCENVDSSTTWRCVELTDTP